MAGDDIETKVYPVPVMVTVALFMVGWFALAVRDIVQQRKSNPVPCDPDVLGRSSGYMGVTRCVCVCVVQYDATRRHVLLARVRAFA